jgi:hypothetical protein
LVAGGLLAISFAVDATSCDVSYGTNADAIVPAASTTCDWPSNALLPAEEGLESEQSGVDGA